MGQMMQMGSNSFMNQEQWDEQNAHSETSNMIANQYKMGGSKMKLGAATSTNFMNQ